VQKVAKLMPLRQQLYMDEHRNPFIDNTNNALISPAMIGYYDTHLRNLEALMPPATTKARMSSPSRLGDIPSEESVRRKSRINLLEKARKILVDQQQDRSERTKKELFAV
jgi:hypothetical protein